MPLARVIFQDIVLVPPRVMDALKEKLVSLRLRWRVDTIGSRFVATIESAVDEAGSAWDSASEKVLLKHSYRFGGVYDLFVVQGVGAVSQPAAPKCA